MGDFLRQGQGPGFTPPFNPAAFGQQDLGQLLFPILLANLFGGQNQGQGFGVPNINLAAGGPTQGAGPATAGGTSAPASGGTPGSPDARQLLEQLLGLGMRSAGTMFGGL